MSTANPAVSELLQRLAALLESHGLGVAALTPRPRGSRLYGDAADAMAELLDALAAAAPSLPAGQHPQSLLFGNGCFAIGRYAEAMAVYQTLAGIRPDLFAVHFNLGVTALRRRMPDAAQRALSRALAIDANSAPAYYQRGNARDDAGDPDGALSDYAAAIRIQPDYLQAHYNCGIVLTNLARYREAVAAFDAVLALNPDLSNAYLNRGVAREELGDDPAAMADFDAALRCNPDNADARFNKARACYRQGRHRQAIADYTAAIKLRPDDVEALNNRGLAYDATGRYQDAVADYDAALLLRPDFAEVLSNRGAAQETLGDFDAALADYLAAQQAMPEFAAAYYNAARIYADRDDLERCARHLTEAVRLQPSLHAEAEADETLGWVLQLTRLKAERQQSESR